LGLGVVALVRSLVSHAPHAEQDGLDVEGWYLGRWAGFVYDLAVDVAGDAIAWPVELDDEARYGFLLAE